MELRVTEGDGAYTARTLSQVQVFAPCAAQTFRGRAATSSNTDGRRGVKWAGGCVRAPACGITVAAAVESAADRGALAPRHDGAPPPARARRRRWSRDLRPRAEAGPPLRHGAPSPLRRQQVARDGHLRRREPLRSTRRGDHRRRFAPGSAGGALAGGSGEGRSAGGGPGRAGRAPVPRDPVRLEPAGPRAGDVHPDGCRAPRRAHRDALAKEGNGWRARGALTFKQSGFGIRPYSGFFGTIAVHNEVKLEYDIVWVAPEHASMMHGVAPARARSGQVLAQPGGTQRD